MNFIKIDDLFSSLSEDSSDDEEASKSIIYRHHERIEVTNEGN